MGLFSRKPRKPSWHRWVSRASRQRETAYFLVETKAVHPSVRKPSEARALARAMAHLDHAAWSLHVAYREGATIEELAREFLGGDGPDAMETMRRVLRDGAELREGAASALPDYSLPDTGWHRGVLPLPRR